MTALTAKNPMAVAQRAKSEAIMFTDQRKPKDIVRREQRPLSPNQQANEALKSLQTEAPWSSKANDAAAFLIQFMDANTDPDFQVQIQQILHKYYFAKPLYRAAIESARQLDDQVQELEKMNSEYMAELEYMKEQNRKAKERIQTMEEERLVALTDKISHEDLVANMRLQVAAERVQRDNAQQQFSDLYRINEQLKDRLRRDNKTIGKETLGAKDQLVTQQLYDEINNQEDLIKKLTWENSQTALANKALVLEIKDLKDQKRPITSEEVLHIIKELESGAGQESKKIMQAFRKFGELATHEDVTSYLENSQVEIRTQEVQTTETRVSKLSENLENVVARIIKPEDKDIQVSVDLVEKEMQTTHVEIKDEDDYNLDDIKSAGKEVKKFYENLFQMAMPRFLELSPQISSGRMMMSHNMSSAVLDTIKDTIKNNSMEVSEKSSVEEKPEEENHDGEMIEDKAKRLQDTLDEKLEYIVNLKMLLKEVDGQQRDTYKQLNETNNKLQDRDNTIQRLKMQIDMDKMETDKLKFQIEEINRLKQTAVMQEVQTDKIEVELNIQEIQYQFLQPLELEIEGAESLEVDGEYQDPPISHRKPVSVEKANQKISQDKLIRTQTDEPRKIISRQQQIETIKETAESRSIPKLISLEDTKQGQQAASGQTTKTKDSDIRMSELQQSKNNPPPPSSPRIEDHQVGQLFPPPLPKKVDPQPEPPKADPPKNLGGKKASKLDKNMFDEIDQKVAQKVVEVEVVKEVLVQDPQLLAELDAQKQEVTAKTGEINMLNQKMEELYEETVCQKRTISEMSQQLEVALANQIIEVELKQIAVQTTPFVSNAEMQTMEDFVNVCGTYTQTESVMDFKEDVVAADLIKMFKSKQRPSSKPRRMQSANHQRKAVQQQVSKLDLKTMQLEQNVAMSYQLGLSTKPLQKEEPVSKQQPTLANYKQTLQKLNEKAPSNFDYQLREVPDKHIEFIKAYEQKPVFTVFEKEQFVILNDFEAAKIFFQHNEHYTVPVLKAEAIPPVEELQRAHKLLLASCQTHQVSLDLHLKINKLLPETVPKPDEVLEFVSVTAIQRSNGHVIKAVCDALDVEIQTKDIGGTSYLRLSTKLIDEYRCLKHIGKVLAHDQQITEPLAHKLVSYAIATYPKQSSISAFIYELISALSYWQFFNSDVWLFARLLFDLPPDFFYWYQFAKQSIGNAKFSERVDQLVPIVFKNFPKYKTEYIIKDLNDKQPIHVAGTLLFDAALQRRRAYNSAQAVLQTLKSQFNSNEISTVVFLKHCEMLGICEPSAARFTFERYEIDGAITEEAYDQFFMEQVAWRLANMDSEGIISASSDLLKKVVLQTNFVLLQMQEITSKSTDVVQEAVRLASEHLEYFDYEMGVRGLREALNLLIDELMKDQQSAATAALSGAVSGLRALLKVC